MKNKYDLQTVFNKFDAYFGVHQSRNIKRKVEPTNTHNIKSINDSHSEQQIHQAHSTGSNRGRGRVCGTARDRGYCKRCCRTHRYGECRAYHRYCSTCGEKGHFARSKLCKYQRWVQMYSYSNVLVLMSTFRVLSTRTRVLSSNCHKYSY